nr:hypothetical protein [Tanacetum cinerariifolium]
MPSFPSPKLNVSCFDDLEFIKDFENEFLAIVYNDALTSKSDHLTETTLSPQHIDKFDLKDETSLSEYDEVEQNILYFNDLFPFNIIYLDDLKSGKDNDDNEIDNTFFGWGEVHGVYVFDFGGLTGLIDEGLRGRTLMEYNDAQGQSVFTSRAWRSLFEIRGPLVHELVLEFFSTFRFGEGVLDLDIATTLQFQGIFCTLPSYTLIRDPMLRLCHRLIACSIARRSQAHEKRAMISGSQFVARLAEHFGLLTEERFQGLTMIAWVAPGPERQQVAAAGAPEAAEDALVADEGA